MPDSILIQLVRDLTTKVDALPDRHELNAIVEPLKHRLETHGADIEELKRSRLPSWLAPVVASVSAIAAGGTMIAAMSHPSPTQAALQPTPPPAMTLRRGP